MIFRVQSCVGRTTAVSRVIIIVQYHHGRTTIAGDTDNTLFWNLAREHVVEAKRRKLLQGRCMGRIWADGWGLRCTAICAEGKDLCGTHLKRDKWKTHGRMDGDVPPAKKEEMRKFQELLLKKGINPPVVDGLTLLVSLSQKTISDVFKKVGA